MIASVLAALCISVLSLFLTFSEGAEHILYGAIPGLKSNRVSTVIQTDRVKDPLIATETLAVDNVRTLPSLYESQEYGGTIPNILMHTPYTQAATVLLASSTRTFTGQRESTPVRRATNIEDALVNIFCTMRMKNQVRASTGSGVFLEDRGVILTNAHVAQFLLLAEPAHGITTTCMVRAGNPAVPLYYAELLYIPPLWVNENAEELHAEHPSGTGERDYALLYVTKAIKGALPSSFPGLTPNTAPFTNSAKNQVVVAAGFPAEALRAEGPKASLASRIATTTITELFTYTKNKVDLVGIAPSSVGEQGSSGGPIVDLEKRVVGLITTKGDPARDGAKSLRAITIPYIDRTIKEETNVELLETIRSDLPTRARMFKEIMTPLLSRIVLDEIE